MNFSSNSSNILNINEAIALLKSEYVLVSFKDNLRYVFLYENHKVSVKSKNFNISLPLTDFMESFKDFKFTLVEKSDQEINLEKDLDYYKNIQKKQ